MLKLSQFFTSLFSSLRIPWLCACCGVFHDINPYLVHNLARHRNCCQITSRAKAWPINGTRKGKLQKERLKSCCMNLAGSLFIPSSKKKRRSRQTHVFPDHPTRNPCHLEEIVPRVANLFATYLTDRQRGEERESVRKRKCRKEEEEEEEEHKEQGQPPAAASGDEMATQRAVGSLPPQSVTACAWLPKSASPSLPLPSCLWAVWPDENFQNSERRAPK